MPFALGLSEPPRPKGAGVLSGGMYRNKKTGGRPARF